MNRLKKQAGVTLIEVLVTLVILSVALTGIAAVQATSMQSASQIKYRSAAISEAQSMLDSMRANRVELASYVGSDASMPDAATQPGKDYLAFQQSLNATLKNRSPEFAIAVTSDRLVTVSVSWRQRKEQGRGVNTKTYSVSAFL